ncbi:MAG: alpha/beta fold hydrolase [Duganella sp.]
MSVVCGCRLLDVEDRVQQTVIPLALLYPAQGVETAQSFGPYTLDVALDAAPVSAPSSTPDGGQGRYPLVVVSHGNAGTPWAYRELARHLVLAGFVVALPAHPGNTRHNNNRANTAANLANRPRHVTLVIDAAFNDPALGPLLAPGRVAVIGHSIGGYTALAVAGGKPWTGPYERKTHPPQPVPVTPDPRVRALVLLAPATAWFLPEALRDVRLPILMITGDRDVNTPVGHAHNVLDGVADRSQVVHRVFEGAAHFSFMSKFPPEMTRPEFHPSQDPPGFDRAGIQPQLFADITTFLVRTLCATGVR